MDYAHFKPDATPSSSFFISFFSFLYTKLRKWIPISIKMRPSEWECKNRFASEFKRKINSDSWQIIPLEWDESNEWLSVFVCFNGKRFQSNKFAGMRSHTSQTNRKCESNRCEHVFVSISNIKMFDLYQAFQSSFGSLPSANICGRDFFASHFHWFLQMNSFEIYYIQIRHFST